MGLDYDNFGKRDDLRALFEQERSERTEQASGRPLSTVYHSSFCICTDITIMSPVKKAVSLSALLAYVIETLNSSTSMTHSE
jgi:hypothetical protein